MRAVAGSLVGRNSAISQSIIRITTTRTTQQMGVIGNFCACTVMRMNIPEMTSRMHTKTPLRPLQLRKRHRLLGFDHLLGSTHSCGNVNGSKAQGIQIAPAESDVRDDSSRKRWRAIHCSGSIPRQSATAGCSPLLVRSRGTCTVYRPYVERRDKPACCRG